jgi:hypothetical protein
MPSHPLNIPGDPNLNGVKVGDTVAITCDDNDGCTWCYSDSNNPQVFSGGFLANGSYDKGSLGTFTAVNPGTVNYDGVKGKNKSCNPTGGIRATMHSIVVSS